jgi:hypothetical protein
LERIETEMARSAIFEADHEWRIAQSNIFEADRNGALPKARKPVWKRLRCAQSAFLFLGKITLYPLLVWKGGNNFYGLNTSLFCEVCYNDKRWFWNIGYLFSARTPK